MQGWKWALSSCDWSHFGDGLLPKNHALLIKAGFIDVTRFVNEVSTTWLSVVRDFICRMYGRWWNFSIYNDQIEVGDRTKFQIQKDVLKLDSNQFTSMRSPQKQVENISSVRTTRKHWTTSKEMKWVQGRVSQSQKKVDSPYSVFMYDIIFFSQGESG